MIVISGALVLVALILLIVGVVGPDLTFVYASIGVSLVSLVFLVIGILQRRGDTGTEVAAAPAPEVAEEPADSVTTVLPSQVGTSRRVTEQAPVAESAGEEPLTGGTVLVVEGRPRYHVDGCRYLSGKQAEEVDVLDAREEGFTPCGVCKPDDALAEDTSPDVEQEEDVVEEDVPGVEVPAPARTATRAVTAPAKKAAKKAPAKAVAAVPAPSKAAVKAPAKAPTKASTKVASKAATKAPSKAATAAAAATPAAASAAKKPGSVVVIPDRGKFHTSACRYVRDVPEAEVLSKSAATRQGYAACGVCKP